LADFAKAIMGTRLATNAMNSASTV
jgi:hypothetical protein